MITPTRMYLLPVLLVLPMAIATAPDVTLGVVPDRVVADEVMPVAESGSLGDVRPLAQPDPPGPTPPAGGPPVPAEPRPQAVPQVQPGPGPTQAVPGPQDGPRPGRTVQPPPETQQPTDQRRVDGPVVRPSTPVVTGTSTKAPVAPPPTAVPANRWLPIGLVLLILVAAGLGAWRILRGRPRTVHARAVAGVVVGPRNQSTPARQGGFRVVPRADPGTRTLSVPRRDDATPP